MDGRLWRSPVGATSRRANEPKVPPPSDEVTLWQLERSCVAINQPEPLSIRHSLIRQLDIVDVPGPPTLGSCSSRMLRYRACPSGPP